MKNSKFKLLDVPSHADASVGDIVYYASVHDYGLSRDDTAILGVEHISVTFNEDGSYPLFTVPIHYLEKVGDIA